MRIHLFLMIKILISLIFLQLKYEDYHQLSLFSLRYHRTIYFQSLCNKLLYSSLGISTFTSPLPFQPLYLFPALQSGCFTFFYSLVSTKKTYALTNKNCINYFASVSPISSTKFNSYIKYAKCCHIIQQKKGNGQALLF